MSDKLLILPILSIAYVAIISPLLLLAEMGPRIGSDWTPAQIRIPLEPDIFHRLFWPVMAAMTAFFAIRRWSRLTFPPHLTYLFLHLALAGLSVVWAFKTDLSLVRFAQQAMIITVIVIPAMLAARTADLMRGIFLCFAFAIVLNLFFVLNQQPLIMANNRTTYIGFYIFKNYLGQCAAVGLLLSLHEILYRGWRRVFAVTILGISTYLLVAADSKGSLGQAILAPALAGVTLVIARKMRISPALVLLPIPIFYTALSYAVGNLINRISWYLFGNFDLSGRMAIWDFANFEIARKPLLGWGYQSFWLVGPDAPSVIEAPGWVKNMPNAHNGYLDTMMDQGYVGLVTLVIFLFATIHAIGRVADRDLARAWLLLTLALFIMLINFLESGWMHGMDILWLIFLIVVAETGRYWRPLPPKGANLNRYGAVIGRQRPAMHGRSNRFDKLKLDNASQAPRK